MISYGQNMLDCLYGLGDAVLFVLLAGIIDYPLTHSNVTEEDHWKNNHWYVSTYIFKLVILL
jgi:hypothetical protein